MSEPDAPFPLNSSTAVRVLEAALLCIGRPLSMAELSRLFDDIIGIDTLRSLLDELSRQWAGRGFELVCEANGWKVQAREEMLPYLAGPDADFSPRYSKAVLETLAVIAYHQPVTRSTIETVRGISVSGALLHQLEDRGWIEILAYQESPGRPPLYATTGKFLDDLGLETLEDLPVIEPLPPGRLPETAPAPWEIPAPLPPLPDIEGAEELALELGSDLSAFRAQDDALVAELEALLASTTPPADQDERGPEGDTPGPPEPAA